MSNEIVVLFPERPRVPAEDELIRYIRTAIAVQKRGMSLGKRPFGAIVVGPDVAPCLAMTEIRVMSCFRISVWE